MYTPLHALFKIASLNLHHISTLFTAGFFFFLATLLYQYVAGLQQKKI